MRKAKQRHISDVNNAPLSAMELAVIAKEKLKPKKVKLDPLNKSKCGLELAGLQPAIFGKHNPNFSNESINMY